LLDAGVVLRTAHVVDVVAWTAGAGLRIAPLAHLGAIAVVRLADTALAGKTALARRDAESPLLVAAPSEARARCALSVLVTLLARRTTACPDLTYLTWRAAIRALGVVSAHRRSRGTGAATGLANASVASIGTVSAGVRVAQDVGTGQAAAMFVRATLISAGRAVVCSVVNALATAGQLGVTAACARGTGAARRAVGVRLAGCGRSRFPRQPSAGNPGHACCNDLQYCATGRCRRQLPRQVVEAILVHPTTPQRVHATVKDT